MSDDPNVITGEIAPPDEVGFVRSRRIEQIWQLLASLQSEDTDILQIEYHSDGVLFTIDTYGRGPWKVDIKDDTTVTINEGFPIEDRNSIISVVTWGDLRKQITTSTDVTVDGDGFIYARLTRTLTEIIVDLRFDKVFPTPQSGQAAAGRIDWELAQVLFDPDAGENGEIISLEQTNFGQIDVPARF